MTTRSELEDYLHNLTSAGRPPTCRTGDDRRRAIWTSEVPADTRAAASECQGCPALVACREYGIEHPKEWGVYGGLDRNRRIDLTRKA